MNEVVPCFVLMLVSVSIPINYGLSDRKIISYEFQSALPIEKFKKFENQCG